MIPQVICQYCSDSMDLDLVRDEQLKAGDWTCPECHRSRDRLLLEQLLVSRKEMPALVEQN